MSNDFKSSVLPLHHSQQRETTLFVTLARKPYQKYMLKLKLHAVEQHIRITMAKITSLQNYDPSLVSQR